MDKVWMIAAAWMAFALVASLISIRLCTSFAIVGIVAGNFAGIQTNPWINLLATFGSGLLTFLAGAAIDSGSLRHHLKPSLAIGAVSFAAPYLGALFPRMHGNLG